MTLDPDAARAAHGELAAALRMDPVRVAWGIHELVNENMAAAARVHAAERGLDTRRHTLVATGGAGPVHACGVARRLGLGSVVIPPLAGVGSAFGLLLAPISFDLTRSYLARLDRVDVAALAGILEEMERDGRGRVAAAGVAEEAMTVRRTADLRYVGQGYEIRVPVAPGIPDRALLDEVRRRFEQEYARCYGQTSEGVPLEVVNWRISVAGPRPDFEHLPARLLQRHDSVGAPPGARPRSRSALFDGAAGFVPTPVYQRHLLAADFSAAGPAIIEEAESTTVVPPGWSAAVSADGCLLLRFTAPGDAA
jgi:N-methylhydantoinase A/oxoprolinase/acetone carboxylase beta subunit